MFEEMFVTRRGQKKSFGIWRAFFTDIIKRSGIFDKIFAFKANKQP